MKVSLRNTVFYGVISFLFMLAGTSANAQDVYLRIYGAVVNSDNNHSLKECEVKVFQDEEYLENYVTESRGKYEFFLPVGHVYRFYFEKPGYVAKNIEIDCVDAQKMNDQFIFSLKADISLFEEVEGIDYAIMDQPIGKGVCNGRKGKVIFNRDYTRMMEEKIANLYIPLQADNSEEKERVTIEKAITGVPNEESAQPEKDLSVSEIFVQAEQDEEWLSLDEVQPIEIHEVHTDKKNVAIKETIKEVQPIAKAEEVVPIEKVVVAEEKVIESKKIVPMTVVESEPYKNVDSDITWRVQLGAFSTSNINAYQGLANVDFITENDGMTRCVVGYFETPMEAAKHKIKLINQGYEDAFLTAYRGDQRLSLKDTGANLENISYTKIKEAFNE